MRALARVAIVAKARSSVSGPAAWPVLGFRPTPAILIPPLDRPDVLGDCLSLDEQLRRGWLCPSIENQRMGAHGYGQDRWDHRAWHHGRRDCAQSGRAGMARDRIRCQSGTK